MKSGERELSVAIEIAREAGALLKENFGKVHEVDFKGRINLVTEMDRKSERLIVDRLRKAFPGDDVWAEEGSELEVWSAQQKADLLAEVCGGPVRFRLHAAR